MGLENFLHADLDNEALKRQTCVSKDDDMSRGHQEPRDYSSYLNALAIYWYRYINIFLSDIKTYIY